MIQNEATKELDYTANLLHTDKLRAVEIEVFREWGSETYRVVVARMDNRQRPGMHIITTCELANATYEEAVAKANQIIAEVKATS